MSFSPSKDEEDAVAGEYSKKENEELELTLSPEEDYRLTVKNYINLVEVPRLENGSTDFEAWDEKYSKAVCKTVTIHVTYPDGSTKDQNYDEFREEMHSWICRPNVKFKMFRHKMASPGFLDYTMRVYTNDFDIKIKGLAQYKNGMVFKSVVTRNHVRRVPGQVEAPKEQTDFGAQVFELPSAMKGQLLGMRAGIVPVNEKYEMLRINMSYEKTKGKQGLIQNLMFWQDDFEIHLTCTDGKAYADGAKFVCAKRTLKANKFTLVDSQNNPVALCEETPNKITIYGSWPLEVNSHVSTQELIENVGHGSGVHAFYPWFMVKREKILNGHYYFASVLTRENVESEVGLDPLYKIETSEENHKKTYKITYAFERQDILGLVTSKSDKEKKILQVDVAPGVDPVLILCLAVCVDDEEH